MLNKKGKTGYMIFALVVVIAAIAIFSFVKSSNSITGGAVNTNPSNSKTYTYYTLEEVSKHSVQEDCWTAVNGKVYNVTDLISKHPGGAEAIISNCGKDGSVAFNTKNGYGSHSERANETLDLFFVGYLTKN